MAGGPPAPRAVRLATLEVRDYRNLAHVALEVPPEGLVLVGDNGHGKTNLLEAAYALQLLRGLRGPRDADGTRFGADGWHVAGVGAFSRARALAVGYDARRRRKQVMVDGVVVPRLADAAGHLPSVYVSPDDQRLAGGGPAERRRYLDMTLGLASPAYLDALAAYRGALVRRNAALRLAGRPGRDAAALDEAAAWEPLLARHGARLWAARAAWAATAAPRFAALCAAIGEPAPSALSLRTPGAPEGGIGSPPHDAGLRDARAEGRAEALVETLAASLSEALVRQRAHDARRGMTHAGPHRDDLALTLGGRDLRVVGSAGQRRTAAFALRLLEAETLAAATGTAPLLLLDDPFAELDDARSARILGLLARDGGGQVLLAVPRGGDVPPALLGLARRTIVDGVVS